MFEVAMMMNIFLTFITYTVQIHHPLCPHGQNTISYSVSTVRPPMLFIYLINVSLIVMSDQIPHHNFIGLPDGEISFLYKKPHTPMDPFFLLNEAYPVDIGDKILHKRNYGLHENKEALFVRSPSAVANRPFTLLLQTV